jgi:hypothetical protein
MAKAPRPWIVTKHGPIEKLEDNLWVVEGDVPGTPFHRRMSIIKRSDGTLLFFNAIPLTEPELAEVQAWGKPAVLVVPHDQHMIDAHAFAEKLGLAVYAPKVCEPKASARAKLAGTLDALPPDPTLRIEPVEGVKNGEPALIVTSSGGRTSLLVSDVLMNSRKDTMGFLPRLMGFAGPVKIVPVFRMMFLKDKTALKKQISAWADLPNLAHLVPCHGDVASKDLAPALRQAAASLS